MKPFCSTGPPGGNQVDGLPPALSTNSVHNACHTAPQTQHGSEAHEKS